MAEEWERWGWQSIDGQPLGDVPAHHGGLLVCHASHRLRAFAPLRASYGEPLSSPSALARVPLWAPGRRDGRDPGEREREGSRGHSRQCEPPLEERVETETVGGCSRPMGEDSPRGTSLPLVDSARASELVEDPTGRSQERPLWAKTARAAGG